MTFDEQLTQVLQNVVVEGMSAEEYWEKIGGLLSDLSDKYETTLGWEIYPGDNARMGPGLEMKVEDDGITLDSPIPRQLAKEILHHPVLRKEFPYVIISFTQLDGEMVEVWPDPV